MRFRAEQHLRRQVDFQRVKDHGRRINCGAFLFCHAARDLPPPLTPPPATSPVARVGFVVSRAAIGNAVARNRAKRRLRAVFRTHQHLVPTSTDLTLVARSAMNRLEYAEIERKFIETCLRTFPPPSPHA